jgi:hypothetical protein
MTRPITRRTLLRRTATLTTGVVAASAVPIARTPETAAEPATSPSDPDPAIGTIVDPDRHHHWDTV